MENRNLACCLVAVPVLGVMAIVSIPVVWAVLYFGIYIGYGNFRVLGHQEFAANGVPQIEPANQMDATFDDCRHYITYGKKGVPLFNSVAFFGDRYKLQMQVPVKIASASTGHTIGEAKFYLNEVEEITTYPNGQIGASFSRNFDFGANEWKQIYDAKGDFSTTGFELDPTGVLDFWKYEGASRPSN